MEARSKKIEDWFSMIEQGQIKLPRFQRHEAWRTQQIAGLFENILRTPPLPVGVLLILEVGDKELFHSRPIVGAPLVNARPHMHLLDGQQRMTALWRSLNDDYKDNVIKEADFDQISVNGDQAFALLVLRGFGQIEDRDALLEVYVVQSHARHLG